MITINSRLKAIWIIGQGKALCRQRIPWSSCARKETVDITTVDRKIIQPMRITSGPA